MRPSLLSVTTAAALLLLPLSDALAQKPIHVATPDGATMVNIGVLAQGSVAVDDVPSTAPVTDVYFRRLRLIAGGQVTPKLKFFTNSDTSYVGRRSDNWATPPTILQDAFVTYVIRPELQIDGGLMLVPLSYNGGQSAASLLPVAYGPYTFVASAPTHSRTGRDQGISARGYLLRNHLEYRVGTFRGAAKHVDGMPLRYAGRVVWYPAGAPTGYFYPGTQHGKRTLVGVGASADRQQNYRAFGADAFAEWKADAGNVVTVQGDVTHYDGSTTFPQLPRQMTWLAEGGYLVSRWHAGPWAQVARQDVLAPAAADSASMQVGATYWARGHTMNIKAGIGRVTKDRVPAHTQFTMQTQLFIF